jgi:hypothetical protein
VDRIEQTQRRKGPEQIRKNILQPNLRKPPNNHKNNYLAQSLHYANSLPNNLTLFTIQDKLRLYPVIKGENQANHAPDSEPQAHSDRPPHVRRRA